jgi:hypothetical protein
MWAVVDVVVDDFTFQGTYVVHQDRKGSRYLIAAPGMDGFVIPDNTNDSGCYATHNVGPISWGSTIEARVSRFKGSCGTYWFHEDALIAVRQVTAPEINVPWSLKEASDPAAHRADLVFERWAASANLPLPGPSEGPFGRPPAGKPNRQRWCEIYAPMAFLRAHPERHGVLPSLAEDLSTAALKAIMTACLVSKDYPSSSVLTSLREQQNAICKTEAPQPPSRSSALESVEVRGFIQKFEAEWREMRGDFVACSLSKRPRLRTACIEEVLDFADRLANTQLRIPARTIQMQTSCGSREFVTPGVLVSVAKRAQPFIDFADELNAKRPRDPTILPESLDLARAVSLKQEKLP